MALVSYSFLYLNCNKDCNIFLLYDKPLEMQKESVTARTAILYRELPKIQRGIF